MVVIIIFRYLRSPQKLGEVRTLDILFANFNFRLAGNLP
jgi:hypothetical protein